MSNTGLKDFLNKINARLGLVLGHDSRQHAKRQRRSMLPWGGDILHGLFGLATDATVEDTKRRLETIEHWAANRGTLVEKAINNINLHSQALQNMSLALDKLVLALNENREVVNELVMLTQFSLQAEDSLNEFADLQESLILAQRGIVSPNLLVPSDFQDILLQAKDLLGYKPLVPLEQLYSYYSLIVSKMVGDIIFCFIPFKSEHNLIMYHISPFPMFAGNHTVPIILKGTPKYFMLTTDLQLLSLVTEKQYESCLSLAKEQLICPHQEVYFIPTVDQQCYFELATNNIHPTACTYTVYNTTQPFVTYTKERANVFLPQPMLTTIRCEKNVTTTTIQGVIQVARTCDLIVKNKLNIYGQNSIVMDRNLPYVKLEMGASHFLSKINVNLLKMEHTELLNTPEQYFSGWQTYKDNYTPILVIVFPLIIFILIIILCFVIKHFLMKELSTINATLTSLSE